RADQHIDGDGAAFKKDTVSEVRGGANPCDLSGRAEQAVSDAAGDHVDLIVVGNRDQHVRIFYARLDQNIWMGALAGNYPDVEPVAQLAQPELIGIHYRNVIGFTGEMLGKAAAYLSSAKDNDLHTPSLLRAKTHSCTCHAIPGLLTMRMMLNLIADLCGFTQARVIKPVVPIYPGQQLTAAGLCNAPRDVQ